MEAPTGSSSLPTSSRSDEIFSSTECPRVLQLGSVQLQRKAHCLNPWMFHNQSHAVPGLEHEGVEWISVQHLGSYGNRQLRLIHNATSMILRPWGEYIQEEDKLKELFVNDGDFVLHAPSEGMVIFPAGRHFPPGSLQIVVDENNLQIADEHTTLPIPELVPTVPCSGWCKKQHIYIDHGMTEKAVVFFNSDGWPIACRENIWYGRAQARWWRFDYSRPLPELFHG